MGALLEEFSGCRASPAGIERLLHGKESAALDDTAGGIAFVTGRWASEIEELAEQLSGLKTPWLLVPVVAAFHNEEEFSTEDAIVGVFYRKAAPDLGVFDRSGELEVKLSALAAERRHRTACLLQTGSSNTDPWVSLPAEERKKLNLIGGASHPTECPHLLVPDPEDSASPLINRGRYATIAFRAPLHPSLCASGGCRYVSEEMVVTQAEGSFVSELGGHSALKALGEAKPNGSGREPTFVARVGDGRPQLIPITGVDPGAERFSTSVRLSVGDKIRFAMMDTHASRESLLQELATFKRELGGALPLSGLYICSALRRNADSARSAGDIRLVRQELGSFGLVGFRSGFEIRGSDNQLSPEVGSSLLALHSLPS